MNTARIENWAFFADPSDKYLAPELIKCRLLGDITGHQRIGDRRHQTTSSIQGKTEDGKVITRNTLYELGEPSSEYERLFPGAKERLLNQLPILP
jgi:hypothetical protein